MYEKIGLKKYTLHHDVFLLKKDDGQKMWYVCVLSKIRDEVKIKSKKLQHTHIPLSVK